MPTEQMSRLFLLRDIGWLENAVGFPVKRIEAAESTDSRLRANRSRALENCFTPMITLPQEQTDIQLSMETTGPVNASGTPVLISVLVEILRDPLDAFPHRVYSTLALGSATPIQIQLPAADAGSKELRRLSVSFSVILQPKSAAQKAAGYIHKLLPSPTLDKFAKGDQSLVALYITEASHRSVRIQAEVIPGPQSAEARAVEASVLVGEEHDSSVEKYSRWQRVKDKIKQFFDDLGGGGGPYTGGSGTRDTPFRSKEPGGGGPTVLGRRKTICGELAVTCV